jgi:hypothetical protein
VVGSLARLLSALSLVLCAIVIASFAVFVVSETKSASGHQQQAVAGGREQPAGGEQPGGLHHAIDEVESAVTAPFAGLVSTSGEWGAHAARLALTLAVYGFGLGFIARALRVHV